MQGGAPHCTDINIKEKESCQTVIRLFDMLNEKFRTQHCKLGIQIDKAAEEWMGMLCIKATECKYKENYRRLNSSLQYKWYIHDHRNIKELMTIKDNSKVTSKKYCYGQKCGGPDIINNNARKQTRQRELDAINKAKQKTGNENYKQLQMGSHQDAKYLSAGSVEWPTDPSHSVARHARKWQVELLLWTVQKHPEAKQMSKYNLKKYSHA